MSMTGQAIALNYGYNWLTGYKLNGRTVVNSGNVNYDYTRVGMWLLGEGEMDGLVEMWDQALGRLLYQSETDDPTTLHFHSGSDAVAGSGVYPSSTGGDQGVDSFWAALAPGLQPLNYHRWAYYAISRKQLINNPPNTHQSDASVWADVTPIGLWRGLRCRTFDAQGAMVGYAFTRNPAWHYVDLLCRRKLFPEFLIPTLGGAQDLPGAVRARFDWAALSDSAAYFDQALASGLPRASGDYSFSQRTSLQACLTQILTVSRSFSRERAGTYALVPDRPRASVFTFSRDNADGLTVTDANLHTAPNQYTANFRDLLVPAIGTISSISFADYTKPVLTTEQPHCAATGDYLVIGNTGTRYDGNWRVDSVPAGSSVTQMTLVSKGSNYPASVGAGGLVGLRFSRFKSRSPEFHHHQHQLARGAVGIGIPRQRNKVAVSTDFANCTWDQASRVSAFQRAVALGPDVVPYVTPKRLSLRAPLFAPDASGSGAIAIQLEPGDVVTIDDTLSFTHAGEYEILTEETQLATSTPAGNGKRSPSAGGLSLTLRPYSDSNYPDVAPTSEPGWPDVPGLPGNNQIGTVIPLEDGEAVFFSGSASDSDSFQMPDGFSPQNLMCWAAPQGYVEGDAHLHFIQDCDAYPTRKVALIYNDSAGATWTGDVNWCAVSWRTQNSARLFSQGNMDYVELTLAGGETVCFGKAAAPVNPPGSAVALPANYSQGRFIGLAFPKSGSDVGLPTEGVCGYFDASGAPHSVLMGDHGSPWEMPMQCMVFLYSNNKGTWRTAKNGWVHCPLDGGKTLAVGGFSILDPACNGTRPPIYGSGSLSEVLQGGTVPALGGMDSQTLVTICGSNGFQLTGHPAHGQKQCMIDPATLVVSCSFQDGEGNTWYGSCGVFALLCDVAIGPLAGIDPVSSGSATNSGGGSGSSAGTSSGSGASFQVVAAQTTPTDGTASYYTVSAVNVTAGGSGYTSSAGSITGAPAGAAGSSAQASFTVTFTLDANGSITAVAGFSTTYQWAAIPTVMTGWSPQ